MTRPNDETGYSGEAGVRQTTWSKFHDAPGPRMLDRSAPLPLWSQLLQDLERRLETGEFLESFPTEFQVANTYSVSRHTVREALRRMVSSGQIEAHRGLGHTATMSGSGPRLGALFSVYDSVSETGQELRNTVRNLEVRTDQLAATQLGLPLTSELIYLERIRYAGAEPLAHDRAWLPRTVAEPLLAVDFTTTSLYQALRDHCQVRPDSGKERIQARIPDDATQKILSLPAGVGVFGIDRLGSVGSRPVEWRQSTVRGDRSDLHTDWSIHQGLRFEAGWPGDESGAR